MKTKILSSSIRACAIGLVITFSVLGCGNRQGSSNNKTGQAAEKEAGTVPSMDIFTAALFGNLDAINDHIKAGADLNMKDEYGSTPLIIAITFGKTDVATALINAGCDLDMQSNDGSTPLHTAAFLCRTEIVKALLEKGADKTIKNNYGSTPYESVVVPFDNVRPVYEQIARDLGPLGLKLNYDRIKETRPVIAEMLK